MSSLSSFIKYHRKKLKLTQEKLASKAGVGIRFIRELEQGKETVRIDKANQVLFLFGFELFPSILEVNAYDIALNYMNNKLSNHSKAVKITLKNKIIKNGFIIKEIIDKNKIYAWKFVPNNKAIKYQQKPDDDLIEIILNRDIQAIEEE